MTFWIAQIIAAVICGISAYSYLKKSKDGFLYLQILANILFFVQYILLGVWSGAVANVINAVKFFSFRQDVINGVKTPLKKTIIFAAIGVVLGILVFDGPLSLIPIFTTVCVTFAAAQDNPVILRLSYTVSNLLCMKIKTLIIFCLIALMLVSCQSGRRKPPAFLKKTMA